ncbi:MAG: tetratricopeptide repeat protein, partial [Pseudomonadota bacterium]|nr:tetratricopeptide repeat protein [Pseudomonadota bacterium]
MDTNKKFQETLALYQEGKLTEAADAVEQLLKINAPNADFFHLAALIKKSQNEIERAEDYFRKSLSIIPQQPVVLSNLANLLKLTNRGPEANKLYKEACRIFPNFFDAWFNRANLCIEMNDFKTAESCLIEAIKIKPNENTQTQLLSLYLKSARYDELLTVSKMFIDKYTRSTQGYLYKARALKALGFDSDALHTLKAALGQVDKIAEIQH